MQDLTQKTILIKTQEELDAIPAAFEGDIIICDKKPRTFPIKVWEAKKNYRHIIVKGYSNVEIHKKTLCDAYGHACVFAYENTKLELHDESYGEFYDDSTGIARNQSSFYSESSKDITDRRRKKKETKPESKKAPVKSSKKTSSSGKTKAAKKKDEKPKVIHPGEKIREILKEKKMTQGELAKRTGVSGAYISNVISGKKEITKSFALALEQALGVSNKTWLRMQAAWEKESEKHRENIGGSSKKKRKEPLRKRESGKKEEKQTSEKKGNKRKNG